MGGKFANHHVDGVPYLQVKQNDSPPPLDIQPLIVNGPSSNRVDITDGHSFADVLPVMNFWAGFSPSVQVCPVLFMILNCILRRLITRIVEKSGVGVEGQPKECVHPSKICIISHLPMLTF